MNTYDYNENFQAEDAQSGMNATQAKKAPNIFKQLIYSVMPGKYGELANVKVKGFIFYYLFGCLIICSIAWIAIVASSSIEIISERLANGYVLVYDRLWVIILILIGISIPICLIITIIVAVTLAISYYLGELVTALIIKAISKKQCSLFDLYKSAVYCQTPVNLTMLCMLVSLVFLEDMDWISLLIGIARIASLIILIFGIQNLPEKPFLPNSNKSDSESEQHKTESNQYKDETVNPVSSTPSKPRVTPGYWTCSCGRQNPSYTGTCTCGKSKY